MSTKKRLYDLLPRYVRYRDHYQGQPLRALTDALELPLGEIEANIDQLYRNWFIETCDEWLVPYIGGLLGVEGLEHPSQLLPSQRVRVANTIALRRRKGTVTALARAAEAVTGWPCHVVEMRKRVLAAPSLRLTPSQLVGTVDLRRQEELDELGGPFDHTMHTARVQLGDPRDPDPCGRTAFNLRTVQLYFWRLRSYPVRGAAARRMRARSAELEGRLFTFHPFGLDTPLYNLPRSDDEPVHATTSRHLPMPLNRRVLAREVAARRAGEVPATDFFGDRPVFRILVRDPGEQRFRAVAPEAMAICDLASWQPPSFIARVERFDRLGAPPKVDAARLEVAVDPERGRIAFAHPCGQREVRVDYCYAASFDVGGGPYPRRRQARAEPATWTATVHTNYRPAVAPLLFRLWGWSSLPDPALLALYVLTCHPPPHEDGRYRSLADALRAFRQAMPEQGGLAVIRIADNGPHPIGGLVLELPWFSRLVIEADDGLCPHLPGDLRVVGGRGCHLRLDGLWIEGRLSLEREVSLEVEHCTVNPPRHPNDARLAIEGDRERQRARLSGRFRVTIRSSIVGAIELPRTRLELLHISQSIVDGGGGPAIFGQELSARAAAERGDALPIGPPTRIERSTILGDAAVYQLWFGVNVLFDGRLVVERPRDGWMHHCFVAAGSTTPRREEVLEAGRPPDDGAGPAVRSATFTTTQFGQPGYLQLSLASRDLLRRGEEGNEIGVYHDLRQSDRLLNLPSALDEFLSAGWRARIRFET